MITFIVKHPIAVILSLFLHVLIALFFTLKWNHEPSSIRISAPSEDPQTTSKVVRTEPMQTFAVDSSQVQAKLEKIKAEQEAKRLEQQKLAQLAEQEKQRLKALQQQQAKEKAEAERARKLAEEQKRKAEAERKKIAEAKRLAALEKKKAEQERKKAEQARQAALEAEKKRKQEKEKAKLAEQQRLAEEKKKRQLEQELALKAEEKKRLEQEAEEAKREKEREQAAAALQRQLEAEAAAQRAEERRKQLLSLRETYISSISAKVKDNWRTPARISPNAQCDLKITQSPKGNITSVKVLNCNRDATKQFQQAAVNAVYRAEPLPAPPVKELFEREITFEFKP